jgi:hypothetical protein
MKNLVFICLLFSGLHLFAQNTDQWVISSGGGYFDSGSSSISFTIGETIISTLSSGSAILTQGFQQSFTPISTGMKTEDLSGEKIFPNPVSSVLYVDSDSDNIDFRLFNSLGNIVIEGKFVNGEVNLVNLPMGLYFIELEGTETYKIIKE